MFDLLTRDESDTLRAMILDAHRTTGKLCDFAAEAGSSPAADRLWCSVFDMMRDLGAIHEELCRIPPAPRWPARFSPDYWLQRQQDHSGSSTA